MCCTRELDKQRSTKAIQVLMVIGIVVLPITASAIESTWSVTGTGSDWFGNAPWTNGIPNQPGDIAVLTAQASAATAGLSGPATVGQLRFGGNANLTISGAGSLHFDDAETASPRITGISTRRVVTLDIMTPVSIDSGQELLLDLNSLSRLRFSGGLNLGNDTVRKIGGGIVYLPSESNGWTGNFFVDGGEASVEHTRALATTSAVTVAAGARLTVVSQDATPEPSRDPYVIPQIVLDGSVLQTNLGASEQVTLLNSNIDLVHDSVIQVSTSDLFYLNGNLTGSGGVSFLERDDPSSPVGVYYQTYLSVDGNTSYSGETIIGPNIWVRFRQSASLGDNNAGTRVVGGSLELSQGGGSEQIAVEHGELWLNGAAVPYGHVVKLDSSQLSGGDALAAVLSTNVEFTNGAVLGSSNAESLIIEGAVTGVGSLAIQGEVEIQGGITARGNLYIRYPSGAKLSGPLDVAGEVFLDRDSLKILDDVGADDTRFRVANTFETADAALTFASNNSVHSIVLDPRQSNREGTFDRSAVIVEPGAALTVSDQLRFMGGRLRGQILGQSVLTKQDRATGILEDIAGSGFQRVDVEAGLLSVTGNVGRTPPEIHLQQHDTSRVSLYDVGTYSGAIYLNNSQGYDGTAALSISGNTLFDGDIFLGSSGASISGSSTQEAGLGPNARIHGGDLTVVGYAPIRIRGGNHTYSGETRVMSQSLVLVDGGRLNSTSAVIGFGRTSGGGGRSGLVLDNSGTTANDDRIPDSTPVILEGVAFKLIGRGGTSVTETLGTVQAKRGISDLTIVNPTPSNSTVLRIETLDRQPGAAVQFWTNNSMGRYVLAHAPQLDDGLIGGWALFGGEEFATYGPNGVVAYSALHSYATELTTATATDNVRPEATRTVALSSDKTINSLSTHENEINLNGHTLTIESGGMLARSFRTSKIGGPGQLTAGTDAGAELLVTGNFQIDANIVDNAQGAVGLTHLVGVLDNSAYLVLSGENTYSGPTIVNSGNGGAVLSVVNEKALPTGGDIFLNGGFLRIEHQPSAPLRLGRMELRDGASVSSLSSFHAQVEPESVLIESGVFLTGIVGNASITKQGPLSANFSDSLVAHAGPISIEEGDFVIDEIGPAPIDDAHAITVKSGGRLRTSSDVAIANRKVRLDGGVIDMEVGGSVSAPLEILSGGGTLRNRAGITVVSGAITGDGPLVVDGGLGNGSVQLNSDLNDFHGALRFTGDRVHVGGNLRYDGSIDVTAADLTTMGGTPFGQAQVMLHPEAQLTVSEPLTAALYLNGGVLKMQFGNSFQSPVLNGTLSVADHSYLFIAPGDSGHETRPRIASDLALQDGSNLVISELPRSFSIVDERLFREQLFIQSKMTVAGSATLTSFDSIVEIKGTITPASPNAVLNLVGNDTFDVQASIKLNDGAELTLMEDGVPAAITLSGGANSLAGNGTLVGNVSLEDGAVASPGNSAGELAVYGDVVLAGGAVYRWEMEHAFGTAGTDWDLLRIAGDLVFDATAANPWVLKLQALPGLEQLAGRSFVIASADRIHSFDPAAVRIDDSGIPSATPSFTAYHFIVNSDGEYLYLQVVPEPSAMSILMVAVVLLPPAKVRARRARAT